jgi:hypothetical protein
MVQIKEFNATSCLCNFYPIQSITEFKTLYIDGTANQTFDTLTSVQIAAGTYDTDDYWLDTLQDPLNGSISAYGKITLKTQTFPVGKNNIKIAGTYGYASVPTVVKELSACLAGIRTWLNFLGAGYNRLNSYSIPQQTADKGDFYARGMVCIKQLTERAETLYNRIGKRKDRLFFASSASR